MIFFQFNHDIHKLTSLDKAILTSNNSLLYEKEGQLFQMDFANNSQNQIRVKQSKVEDQNKIRDMISIANGDVILCYHSNSLKFLRIENEKNVQITTQLGFQCPYCLLVLSQYRALSKDHMSRHKGPVICSIYKVFEESTLKFG